MHWWVQPKATSNQISNLYLSAAFNSLNYLSLEVGFDGKKNQRGTWRKINTQKNKEKNHKTKAKLSSPFSI